MVTRCFVAVCGALSLAALAFNGLAARPALANEPQAAQPPNVEVDPVVAQVRQKLAEPGGGRTGEREDRAALAAFYAERNGPPLWVAADGFTPPARQVIAEIGKADDWGLSAAAFALPKLGRGPLEPATLADAEIKLGLAVLKYARHARGGRFDPSQLSRSLDQRPNIPDPKSVIQAIAAAPAADAYLRSLHPKHPQFEQLRKALLAARGQHKEGGADLQRAGGVVPPGPRIKPGARHPHVALVRQRLGVAGRGDESYYDERLWQAVRSFQREHGLEPDGVISNATRSALNGGSRSNGGGSTQRLIVNMERWRWMPDHLGEFHVWDNVPEFTMRVVKNGQVIHGEKIIVGKTETQTPIFSANMEFIVFHPEWGVPDSIKVSELWPYLRGGGGGWYGGVDTSVLRRHNLKVSYNGHPVDPNQVDWEGVDIRRFQFTQPAGPHNVLGVVKFRFPNKHDVYMHDTPQRELFARGVRTFSHGCIRVQNPQRLAEILLAEDKGWSAAQVGSLLADRDINYNKEIRLTRKIPVHVTYFTAVADDNGSVRLFDDIYGHDERVAAALEGRPARLPAAETWTEAAPWDMPRRPRRDPRWAGPGGGHYRDIPFGLWGN
jgi:L,D-transpeptidase YcbB